MSRPAFLQLLYRPLARTARLTLPVLSLLCVGASSPLLAQQGVQVRETDGLLSIQASNTTASELADVLSQQLGISVVVTGNAETRVNIDIVDEPLDKALSRLSPNHLLIRDGRQVNGSITEVILMMGEGSDSASTGDGGDDAFLPSGSPAEDVVIEEELTEEQALERQEALTATEEPPLRDPSRAAIAREAAEGSPLDGTENGSEAPPADLFDPITGLPIDPATGLPIE